MPRWQGTFESRFWDKVEKTDGCWKWLGTTMKNGYGQYARHLVKEHSQLAHRWAWRFSFGDIPEGMQVLHHCDRRGCVNPNHLFLGSNTENMRDKARKGRHHNQLKTHCPKGHEYTPQNTHIQYFKTTHSRQCKTCLREYRRRLRARKRTERSSAGK